MRPLLFLVALVALAVPAAAQGTHKPSSVLATPWVDILPAASEDYLAYSQLTNKSGGRFDVWAKPTGSPRFRVNVPGTTAFAGSIDGDRLVFEQRKAGRAGQIKLANLATRKVRNAPGVNTPRHEANPALSGDYLVFNRSRTRDFSSPRRVVLRNLDTGQQRVLDAGRDAYVQAGGIAGTYVVWVRCQRLDRCRTWVYDIAAETKSRIPNPEKRSQFAAAVTADGTVYYAESGSIFCKPHKTVRLWRKPPGAPRELVWKLSQGLDPAHLSPVVLGDGTVELYFDRFGCRSGETAIFKSVIPAP